jgi:hypothetical protein
VSVVLWSITAAGLIACEAAARVFGRGWPRAGELLRRARNRLSGRLLLVVIWLWLGWHSFAR